MNLDVDPDGTSSPAHHPLKPVTPTNSSPQTGWQYSFSHSSQSWSSRPSLTTYARRRRWIRMRKPIDTSLSTPTSPPPQWSSPSPKLETAGADLVRRLQGRTMDKERVEVVVGWVGERGDEQEGEGRSVGRDEVTKILNAFDHECYKLRAASLLVPSVVGDVRAVQAVERSLKFWSDRVKFRDDVRSFKEGKS
ncbi:hypothetical protein HK097_002122 [Rhizophlyctis rosea]|uniref:Peroxin/Ferlin domain-containing protein n=1 Tax=Rhizophlyctis rosea TaxID=64517 RepID=A0AAD5S5Q9_9FUNG|nr:hypothetical protein HK097_002122 [Rhizophlyctis rosea]